MSRKTERVLPSLRRYTTLPVLLDLLKEKQLTLISPTSWADRNDSFYLELYMNGRKAKSVLALCLSEAGETFHHWKVFTKGSDGVCIQFHRDVLLDSVNSIENLLHGPVEYVEINKAKPPRLDRLPFLKRFPYRDEKEYRLVYIDPEHEIDFKCVPIPIDSIEKITLSPWLPENLRRVVSETICSVAGCAVQVSNTALLDNERWKNLGRRCCVALEGEVGPCVRS
jgi:hypothetical protein